MIVGVAVTAPVIVTVGVGVRVRVGVTVGVGVRVGVGVSVFVDVRVGVGVIVTVGVGVSVGVGVATTPETPSTVKLVSPKPVVSATLISSPKRTQESAGILTAALENWQLFFAPAPVSVQSVVVVELIACSSPQLSTEESSAGVYSTLNATVFTPSGAFVATSAPLNALSATFVRIQPRSPVPVPPREIKLSPCGFVILPPWKMIPPVSNVAAESREHVRPISSPPVDAAVPDSSNFTSKQRPAGMESAAIVALQLLIALVTVQRVVRE